MGNRPANFATDLGYTATGSGAIVAQQIADRKSWKQAVRVATTGNVTISTALNAGDTIDGVTLALGDRVLVWQQTAGAGNGIYVVDPTPFRAPDFDVSDEIVGAFVPVTAGTTLAGKVYRNTNTSAITMETTAITFEEFSPTEVAVYDHGSMGATETLDLANGTWHRGTLDAACTITVTGWTVDQALVATFKVTQDGTGGWGITWDADVVFLGNDQPDLTAAGVTYFLLWSDEGDATVYAAKVGSGGLTIKEEGVALATLAESLDFVGAGVVASGTGIAKTITISGAPAGAAGGDLSGTYPNPTIDASVIAAVSDLGDHEHIIDVFSGDASTTAFEITQEPADPEAVYAFVAGAWTAVTVSGAMNTTVTFGSAPASGTDNVAIQYPAVVA